MTLDSFFNLTLYPVRSTCSVQITNMGNNTAGLTSRDVKLFLQSNTLSDQVCIPSPNHKLFHWTIFTEVSPMQPEACPTIVQGKHSVIKHRVSLSPPPLFLTGLFSRKYHLYNWKLAHVIVQGKRSVIKDQVLFHALSLDYFHGNITYTTGSFPIPLFKTNTP